MTRNEFVFVASVSVLACLGLRLCDRQPRPYFHHIEIAEMARTVPCDAAIPTHVEVSGFVRYVRQETDGDLHIRLCDEVGACIVGECIPSLPCDAPGLGSYVTLRGISRYDTQHRWAEVHPVLGIKEGRGGSSVSVLIYSYSGFLSSRASFLARSAFLLRWQAAA